MSPELLQGSLIILDIIEPKRWQIKTVLSKSLTATPFLPTKTQTVQCDLLIINVTMNAFQRLAISTDKSRLGTIC